MFAKLLSGITRDQPAETAFVALRQSAVAAILHCNLPATGAEVCRVIFLRMRRVERRYRRIHRALNVPSEIGDDRPGVHLIARAQRTTQRRHLSPIILDAAQGGHESLGAILSCGTAHSLRSFRALAVRVPFSPPFPVEALG